MRREGIQVVSVIEQIDDSPLSFIFEGIIDLFAAYYSINLSNKIRAGLRKVVENGGWPYKPPTGYEKANGDVIVAAVGPSILTAFQEFSTGQYTLEQWAEQAYTMGIRSPDGNRLGLADWGRIFRNKFYIGDVEYSDISTQGNHQPLISTELFEQVQEILDAHSPNTKVKTYRSYLLRGLLWSLDADSWMTGAVGKGYLYYRSRRKMGNGKRHYVSAETLENDVSRALQTVMIPKKCVDQLDLDQTLGLALRVSPNVGILYENLEKKEQRQKLLSLAVKKYGFKVSGHQIVDIDARAPFIVQFDQKLVEMARVELASRKAGNKRLRV